MKLPVSESQFLHDYWQQRPLLLPQAFPNFISPISADELAGCAMEEHIESRLVTRSNGIWAQLEGPFSAQDFRREDEWTLLVQGLDLWHEGVAALRRHLDFLPSWRFDDIMVSYAVDGAGVGPHFDRYDVFLLQGEGCREWRVGPRCDGETPTLQEQELNLIPEFEPNDTYLLSPGDVLYIPPHIAHWGIARGESLTFSLGFRAPSIADLLARRTDDLLEWLDPTSLLEDLPGLSSGRPGEITHEHVRNAKDAIANALDALDNDRWFGETVTRIETLDADDDALPAPPLVGPLVQLTPHARVAWSVTQLHLDVFINGEAFTAPVSATSSLVHLCSGKRITLTSLSQSAPELFEALISMDALENSDADTE